MSATMTTAAIATIATVDAARIIAPFFPMNGRAKLTAHQGSSARSTPHEVSLMATGAQTGAQQPETGVASEGL
jgi:hypothetical protein